MERVYPIFGFPMDVVTDQDPLFRSHVWTHFCKTNEIQQAMSTAYHTESDGQIEMTNKAILAILRAKLFNQGGTYYSHSFLTSPTPSTPALMPPEVALPTPWSSDLTLCTRILLLYLTLQMTGQRGSRMPCSQLCRKSSTTPELR